DRERRPEPRERCSARRRYEAQALRRRPQPTRSPRARGAPPSAAAVARSSGGALPRRHAEGRRNAERPHVTALPGAEAVAVVDAALHQTLVGEERFAEGRGGPGAVRMRLTGLALAHRRAFTDARFAAGVAGEAVRTVRGRGATGARAVAVRVVHSVAHRGGRLRTLGVTGAGSPNPGRRTLGRGRRTRKARGAHAAARGGFLVGTTRNAAGVGQHRARNTRAHIVRGELLMGPAAIVQIDQAPAGDHRHDPRTALHSADRRGAHRLVIAASPPPGSSSGPLWRSRHTVCSATE